MGVCCVCITSDRGFVGFVLLFAWGFIGLPVAARAVSLAAVRGLMGCSVVFWAVFIGF